MIPLSDLIARLEDRLIFVGLVILIVPMVLACAVIEFADAMKAREAGR